MFKLMIGTAVGLFLTAAPAFAHDSEMAPQALEIAQNGLGNGVPSPV
jgi:hypothetical protein